MNTQRTSAFIRIIIWAAVALLLLALLLVGMNHTFSFPRANFFSIMPFSSVPYSNEGDTYVGGASVPAGEIDSVHIDWIDGKVIVVPGDTEEILFSESSRYDLEDAYKLHYRVRDGGLYIQYCASNLTLNWPRMPEKTLTVTVPREAYFKSFDVEAISATVELTGIRAQDMDIETVSGRLSMASLEAGEIEVEGVSGRIEIEDITAGILRIYGISGEVRIMQSVLEEVECEVVSGAIRIEPGAHMRSLHAESVSGSIRIGLPENEGFTARYSEGINRFSCDFPVNMQDRHKAVYGNGAAQINIESLSGSVSIEKIA